MSQFPPTPRRPAAFTLLELVVVIAIIVVIASLAVPAMSSVLRGSSLTQGASLVTAQISGARQQALSRNRPMEVRFYLYANPEQPGEKVDDESTWKFRAMQVFEISESGVALPFGKLERIPTGVVISKTALSSTDFFNSDKAITPDRNRDPSVVPTKGSDGWQYKYVSFRFQPDGSTTLPPTTRWFVTLHADTDSEKIENPTDPSGVKAPPNFYTLQVDPVSGTTRSYRPTAG